MMEEELYGRKQDIIANVSDYSTVWPEVYKDCSSGVFVPFINA